MSAIGFIGKLPAEGDFVHRRLPWAFQTGWDAWLQSGVAHSRTAMGDDWLAQFMVAPVWRFLLGAECLNAGQTGWGGLWFPSVDRVGRYFPFTVAFPLTGAAASAVDLITLAPMFDALEDLALSALDPRISVRQLDVALQAFPLPLPAHDGLPVGEPPVAGDAVHVCLPDGAPGDLLTALAVHGEAGSRGSVWHSPGSDRQPATLLVSGSLPGARFLQACLTGCWDGVSRPVQPEPARPADPASAQDTPQA